MFHRSAPGRVTKHRHRAWSNRAPRTEPGTTPREPTGSSTTSNSQRQEPIDLRGDPEILDPRFPPLQVLWMMTNQEYLQYQKEFLKLSKQLRSSKTFPYTDENATDSAAFHVNNKGTLPWQDWTSTRSTMSFDLPSRPRPARYFSATSQAPTPAMPYTLKLLCL